ncbi:hypothetical protein H2198_010429 [Neophaeococcomyces mojaviensis]|uniref:Uncharacterized protein n=1 Tax=Neophaeococcomyces mojaviensis TaxID=3383035 RepID=A0ACC2ZS79_9EURO|nr:hypothetical protein H2198_010429 [Knufia sp. JES_112]
MSATDPADPKTLAMKTRVLTHMTTDHADSLALYLRHYSKLPASSIPLSPPVGMLKLEDVTLDHMIISHPGGGNLVYIDPPMKSLMESRERLVGMHKDCLTGLGLSDIKIDSFVLPNKAWQWVTHLVTTFCFVTFSFFRSEVYRIWSFGGLVPGLGALAEVTATPVLWLMLAIHISEAGYFARTRLRKHWVQRFSPLWWMWTTCVFNGGVAGITRFDEMVEVMKAEREKGGKH